MTVPRPWDDLAQGHATAAFAIAKVMIALSRNGKILITFFTMSLM
jgi:hypothetical protein